MLAVECQPSRIEMRLRTKYLDAQAKSLDEALAMIERSRREKKPLSVGLIGNAAEIVPELLRARRAPDVVTDQTSAHDPINGYLPKGWTLASGRSRRELDPMASRRRPSNRWPSTCAPCWNSTSAACRRSTTATTSARWRKDEGVGDAFDFPGFVPAYIRPLFCRGVGPFRWAALSGDPEDIFRTDAKVKELMPDDPHLHRLARHGEGAHSLPGSAGAHLLGGPGRPARLGLAFNEMVASGELKAPDRHRPRPSGCRLRGQPEPRDRGHARRLGRRIRLAAAQRAPELRLAARHGCRSTTAAASASATPSTPAW